MNQKDLQELVRLSQLNGAMAVRNELQRIKSIGIAVSRIALGFRDYSLPHHPLKAETNNQN